MPCLSLSLQTLPLWLRGGGRSDQKCYWASEKKGNETEDGAPSAVSCLWQLVDVGQVGVIEDGSDSIQGVCLPYSLQLYLGTLTNNNLFI